MTDHCVVCRAPGPSVCVDDRKQIAKTLAGLPERLARLGAQLVRGTGEGGERVAVSSKVEAGIPARMAALSLSGPGAYEVPKLHPLIRHWRIKQRVTVHGHVNGVATVFEQDVTYWYREKVLDADGKPVTVPDDDQIGATPPREWLDHIVRSWRSALGHHVPKRTTLAVDGEAARWLRLLRGQPTLEDAPAQPVLLGPLLRARTDPRLIAAVMLPAAVAKMERDAHFGLAGYQAPADRSLDPLMDDIERRFGRPTQDRALLWDVQYLLTWLDAAAEQDLGMADFAAELHALDAEIARVLQEDPDQTWLGRCPARIAENTGDDTAPVRMRTCGAGLWQDNAAFSAQVRCPRCHITWDTRGAAGAGLAREIRKRWPIDRRRRYSVDEIDRMPRLKCPTCENRVKIEWRDVTGTRDKVRWWQPTGCSCPKGCTEAGRLI